MSENCAQLHRALRGLVSHSFPFDQAQIPSNGIYVLFEKGEVGHDGKRIVRVGTHTGQGHLRARLEEHFLTANKDRSIFRKNVGRALLNRDRDPFLKQWEYDLTSKFAREKLGHLLDYAKQSDTERRVTIYIQDQFEFVAFSEPSKASRLELEAGIISSVSLCNSCSASATWLGLSSPKDKIRESGLWQVQKLYGTELSNSQVDLLVVASS